MEYSHSPPWIRLALCISIAAGVGHCLTDRSLDSRPASSSDFSPDKPSAPALSCDFEAPCSWTLSNHSAGGDWLVTSPQQPRPSSENRQPGTDHSTGGSDGHFLLLAEGGSAVGCEFAVTSPVLPHSAAGCRLQLARYQPEPSRGNLSVQIRDANTNRVSRSPQLRDWGLDSNRQWEVLAAPIGQREAAFQIILLYSSCGSEAPGTLGLDSLELRDCETGGPPPLHGCVEGVSFPCAMGNCIDRNRVCDFHRDCPLEDDEGAVCESLPLGSHCSFESGLCGWSLSSDPSPSPSPSWSLVSSHDLSTSPDVLGSTLQTTGGHFLFLQVRSDVTAGSAVAQSHTLPPTATSGECQVQFSLYVFGVYNGTVSLSVQEDSSLGVSPLVWERAGSWKDSWLELTLQLPDILHRFHLTLRAVWGPGSRADLSVDGITLGASCFDTDKNPLFPRHKLQLDSVSDLGFFNPLPEPSSSEVSTWWFTSCGASGPRGPTQAQCDSAYRNTNVNVGVGVGREVPLRGVQMWRVPASNRYMISAYGAAGGKGAKNHNKRSHGVFISAIFPLEKDDVLYILVGQQGEDACPGRNPLTQQICLGESSVIEDEFSGRGGVLEWAGGGGGGGGATYIFRKENGSLVPLLIAAGGGGKAYLEDPERGLDDIPLEQYENSTAVPGVNGLTGVAGGGGGWSDVTRYVWGGKSLLQGAEGGSSCPQALSKLAWATFGGFGGGGGACTAGGGGGGYRGGDAAETDDITADGQDGISFVNPIGEIFLQPLAAMESHGEAEIKVQLNCSHCESETCKRDEETKLITCLCDNGEELASNNVTCTAPRGPAPEGHLSLPLILAVVVSTVVTGAVLACASLILIYYRKKQQLQAVRVRLQSPEYKLSKIRTSTIMTDYNPNYCFAGNAASLNDLKEVPRQNITLLRALGHGAFGEVYEGRMLGSSGENRPLPVAIKTLPEICSEQDEMDFLMEALIMSKFSHQNIVHCVGVSLQTLPRFILLELMTGGDMKSFLRQNRPKSSHASSLSMLELLHMARDIACGSRYLEENHFIHRDIAARNCLLTCSASGRVAKIGDFGMARDIYRASYYRKGGRAMLPVKWMPPEAFLEGVFTSKTDTWSFGVLLWEIFSLGYMPYPCKTNQEVLEFVTSGGRMDPPKNCPGPVYRIMTQCWQHCPEHRPNFTTILERISYCTQDPDVINTPLPIEYGPPAEEESSTVMPPQRSGGGTPLLVTSTLTPEPDLSPGKPHPQGAGTGEGPSREACHGAWLHPDPAPLTPPGSTSSGNQKLKNKTKNLWNPTYGSWVLESLGRGKSSQPPAPAIACPPAPAPAPEREDSGFEGNSSSSPSSRAPLPAPASPPPSCGGVELVKLQSFPCGNVNYAYDEESLPCVEPSVSAGSSGVPVPPAAAASVGVSKALACPRSCHSEEGAHLIGKPEKPTRDRDSGFSLSEDLSVTPV
ncbi:leukocyte tyrosine kinase receptor [Acipenser oxyrinchus oxyrinchus]|uniref:Tyrosine-protein kinase receptor n=1 Tax=Acipenser oxyrinchus oxyrinchus TaxID=40147 RepID=A0AAD8G1E7_ACIOX|nr:leukocyte tyrosine kinase receptor [Acipenser oxyrinchus oxyrinchus]